MSSRASPWSSSETIPFSYRTMKWTPILEELVQHEQHYYEVCFDFLETREDTDDL